MASKEIKGRRNGGAVPVAEAFGGGSGGCPIVSPRVFLQLSVAVIHRVG